MSSTSTSLNVSTSSEFRLRQRRRLSIPAQYHRQPQCQPLPHSLEALDLSSSSPAQKLASLRTIILDYLAELETRLTQFQSPDFEAWKAMGETKIEEVRQKTQATLDMLQSIRTDVCSHLPELHLPSVGVFANSFHDVPVINGMRSHLPTFSPIPSLADMCAKLEAIRTRLHGVDFHPQAPLAYLPTLSTHLNTLEEHLSSIELPRVSGFAPSAILSDVLDTFLHSDLVSDLMDAAHEVKEGEERLEKAAMDIAHAIKRSLQGSRLIEYTDLPHQWRNNPFVLRGYRYALSPPIISATMTSTLTLFLFCFFFSPVSFPSRSGLSFSGLFLPCTTKPVSSVLSRHDVRRYRKFASTVRLMY